MTLRDILLLGSIPVSALLGGLIHIYGQDVFRAIYRRWEVWRVNRLMRRLRRDMVARRPHCWLRLRRHTWFGYTVEYRSADGTLSPPELHRSCIWCHKFQVQVGGDWLTCPRCR
jgi:hypothetical protein